MAPILIDNRGLIKLGLISLLTVLVVFSAGYFSGYQKATLFYTMANEFEVLDLPEQNIKETSSISPQLPEVIIVGEEIDVDQPVVIGLSHTQNKSSNTADVVNKQPEVKETERSVKRVEVSSDGDARVDINKENVDKPPSKKITEVSNLTEVELSEIKYSAQVGMYGNLINAENMVKMLQAKKFNAYVADYTNKKNEVQYNVRFGYFIDKKTAIAALKRYKKVEKGDGYLVNFSVDNIVKLADKNNIKPVVPVEIIDKTELLDNPGDGTDAGEITHNETTQAKPLSKV